LVRQRDKSDGAGAFAAAALLLGAGLVSSSNWAAAFSNGELSVSLPDDWEMDSSDQYGTYFNSRDKFEQLVISSMAMKTTLVDAELRRVVEKLVESRSNSMKTLAQGAEPKVDKKLVEVKGDSGSAVLRGLALDSGLPFSLTSG
jgi:hypothetical protein